MGQEVPGYPQDGWSRSPSPDTQQLHLAYFVLSAQTILRTMTSLEREQLPVLHCVFARHVAPANEGHDCNAYYNRPCRPAGSDNHEDLRGCQT